MKQYKSSQFKCDMTDLFSETLQLDKHCNVFLISILFNQLGISTIIIGGALAFTVMILTFAFCKFHVFNEQPAGGLEHCASMLHPLCLLSLHSWPSQIELVMLQRNRCAYHSSKVQ